jgi:hypothetical protein
MAMWAEGVDECLPGLTTDSMAFVYLPHETYEGAKEDHDLVMSYRGAHRYPIRFGLLGGENLITLPAEPDSRPDYY